MRTHWLPTVNIFIFTLNEFILNLWTWISLKGSRFGVMNHVRKDVRIYGHKDVYFFISEIVELNALGHKSAF